MYNHVPPDYICPICLGLTGVENQDTLLKQADRIYSDEHTTAFINSFWVGKNEGHVIVVPNIHFEHFYDLPTEVGTHIFLTAQKIAAAMKIAYRCDGITLRQNNEPAGDQHAFHYHLHIFPRYEGDTFNESMAGKSRLSDPNERLPYAKKMRDVLNS